MVLAKITNEVIDARIISEWKFINIRLNQRQKSEELEWNGAKKEKWNSQKEWRIGGKIKKNLSSTQGDLRLIIIIKSLFLIKKIKKFFIIKFL